MVVRTVLGTVRRPGRRTAAIGAVVPVGRLVASARRLAGMLARRLLAGEGEQIVALHEDRRDALLDDRFDRAQRGEVVERGEGRGDPLAMGAGGAADAVEVVLAGGRDVVVDDA